MKTYIHWVVAVMATIAVSASAQVIGSGATGTVPVFTGPSTIGNSPIAVSGSNVGIGTTNPTAILDVNAGANNYDPSLTYGAPAAFSFKSAAVELAQGVATTSPWAYWLQTRQLTNIAQPMALNPLGGNVGIGTASPQAKLEVASGDVTGNFQVYNALTVRPMTGTGGYRVNAFEK